MEVILSHLPPIHSRKAMYILQKPECQLPRTPLMMLKCATALIWNIFSYGIPGHTWEFRLDVLRWQFPWMVNSSFLKGQWNSTLVVLSKFYPQGVPMESKGTGFKKGNGFSGHGFVHRYMVLWRSKLDEKVYQLPNTSPGSKYLCIACVFFKTTGH